MAITAEDVRRYLGNSRIYERACDYADQKLVGSIVREGDRIVSFVDGSGAHPYMVVLDGIPSGARPLESVAARCTCPYPYTCKHTGAVLLAIVERFGGDFGAVGSPDALGQNRGLRLVPPSELPAPPAPPEPPAPPAPIRFGVIDLGDEGATTGLPAGGHPTAGGRSAPAAGTSFHRTRVMTDTERGDSERATLGGVRVLIYVVRASVEWRSRDSITLTVGPEVRYLKQDGAPGAVSPWRPSTEALAHSRAELEILPICDRYPGRRMPLASLLPQLVLAGTRLPMWYVDEEGIDGPAGSLEPLRLEAIEWMEVGFCPLVYDATGVLFAAAAMATTDASSRVYLAGRLPEESREAYRTSPTRYPVRPKLEPAVRDPLDEDVWLDLGEGLVCLLDRRTRVLAWSAEPSVIRSCRELVKPRIELSPWHRLTERAERYEGERVIVVIPPRRMEVRREDANIVVRVEGNAISVLVERRTVVEGERDEDAGWILDYQDTSGLEERVWALQDRLVELVGPLSPYFDHNAQLACRASTSEILARIAEPLFAEGIRIELEGHTVRTGAIRPVLRVTSSGEEWFGVQAVVMVDGEEVTPTNSRDIMRASDGSLVVVSNSAELDAFRRRYRLVDDAVRIVTADDAIWDQDLESALAEDHKAVDADEQEEAKALLRRARAILEQAGARRAAWRALTERLAALSEADGAPAPGFGAQLRPYQLIGHAWLRAVLAAGLGALLADDMGLGKTVQTLALLHRMAAEGNAASATGADVPSATGSHAERAAAVRRPLNRVLVVAPAATLENWVHETRTFAPTLTAQLYHGPGRALPGPDAAREAGDDAPSPHLIVTTYQTMMRDVEVLAGIRWDVIVFDEVQVIKNAKTGGYRAARRLEAAHLIALSGTPVENTSLELFAVVDLLNPRLLGTRQSFSTRFAGPVEVEQNAAARARLREFLKPILLRRRKAEVARDLPPRDEIPLYVALPPAQRALYERVRAHFETRYTEAPANKRLFILLEGLNRLRQAAIDHRLLAGTRFGPIPAVTAAKMAMLEELLPSVISEDHRVLIFSQFVAVLSHVAHWLGDAGYTHCYLDGSMTPAARRDEIARFQATDGPPIFLISLRAGGTGINLTAADYVILLDPWWNPAVEDQAIDRTHRIGQTRPVTAYRLIAADTVEERIAALQERKRALARDIVPDEETTLASLNDAEIRELFR